MPEAEEALGVVCPEEEHGELWILKLNFPTLSTKQKVIAVSTDGGVCPKVLNGDEPAPALVVLEQLEVEPYAQGEVGHFNHPLVQEPGAADGVGIGISQADLSETNWPSQTNAYRILKNLTLLSKTRMESASMARRPQKIARRGKCPLMMAFRVGRLSLPNLSA